MSRLLQVFLLMLTFSGLALGQEVYRLPQVADGDGIQVTFIASNPGNLPVAVFMEYRDPAGAAMSLNILGLGPGTTHNFLLAAGETRFLTTSAAGPVRVGSATVTATGPITISSIFGLLNPDDSVLTETGIAPSEPLDSFSLAVDSGELNTGLAIQNTANSDTEVTFTLYPIGESAAGGTASTMRTLPANGQLAIFATGPGQLFPELTGVQGKMLVTATNDIAALTLRQGLGGAPLTTFPIVASTSTDMSFELSQIAKGTVIQTGFVFWNVGSSPGTVSMELTDNDGNPLPVQLEGTGLASASSPSGTASNSFLFSLDGDGSIFVNTAVEGADEAGAAAITSTVPIGVTAVFRLLDGQGEVTTEAGVGNSPRGTSFSFPVDTTQGFNTGVAIFNNNPSSTTVQATLLGLDGQALSREFQLAPFEILGVPPVGVDALPAFGHSSQFVTQIFTGAENRRGRANFTATQDVSLLPLRQGPNSLTTLPFGSSTGGGPGPGPMGSELLRTVVSNVPLNQNVVRNQQLDGGFQLSGSVMGPQNVFLFGGVRAVSNNDVYAGVSNFTGNYAVIVPAGTFDVQACAVVTPIPALPVEINPAGGASSVTFLAAEVENVVVTEDTEQNIPVPTPTLFDVSGTITGLTNLPGNLIGTVFVVFGGTDTGTTALAPIGEDGSYAVSLTAGNYDVSIIVAEGEDMNLDGIPEDITSAGSFYQVGTKNVAGASSGNNYAFPDLGRVSGTVTQAVPSPSGVEIAEGASVIAADTNFPENSLLERCFPIAGASFGVVDSDGSYGLYVRVPSTQSIFANIPFLNLGTPEQGALVMPRPGSNVVMVNGDITQNFDFPATPPVVTISGIVTDPEGAPVENVRVSAAAMGTLSGVATAGTGGDLSFSASTRTNASGEYSLEVLAGTYTLTYDPPPPVLSGNPPFPIPSGVEAVKRK